MEIIKLEISNVHNSLTTNSNGAIIFKTLTASNRVIDSKQTSNLFVSLKPIT